MCINECVLIACIQFLLDKQEQAHLVEQIRMLFVNCAINSIATLTVYLQGFMWLTQNSSVFRSTCSHARTACIRMYLSVPSMYCCIVRHFAHVRDLFRWARTYT